MSLPIILSINDGTDTVAVPACATRRHTISSGDTGTGYGTVEYLTGRARRHTQFRRRTWTFQASGAAASGLDALDLTADYWTATFRDPLNADGASLVVTVVPFSAEESYTQPSAEQTISLSLEETIE